MTDNYSIKVNLTRLTFLLLAFSCWILYKSDLADYILLILIAIVFGGLFTISTLGLTSGEVRIKKSYFWGLFNLKENIPYEQILSIRTKEYEIETHEDIGIFTESIFSFLTLEFLKPKVTWLTTKLSYLDNGETKDIELKITKDDFKSIEKEIVSKDEYQNLSRRRKHSAQQKL
jgi:hypothetical protein